MLYDLIPCKINGFLTMDIDIEFAVIVVVNYDYM